MKFSEAVKNHLSDYKKQELGVYENGVWRRNDRPYPHILPPHLWDFNLLENYRQEMISHIERENIHLHHDFHHLNSSQAVCLNFFYPIAAEQQIDILLNILQLEHETVDHWAFEKVLFPNEGTSFDFYLKLQSKRKVFFEIKYSEQEFGRVKSIGKYRRKYEEFYKNRLQGKIRPGLNEYEQFIKHYQLLRNIAYLDLDKKDLFIIICPQNNEGIKKEFHDLSEQVIVPELHGNIRLLTWETMIAGVNQMLLAANAPLRLLHHYSQFEDKYLL